MVRQTQPIINPKGPYPTLQPAANSLDFVFTACDAVNFDEFTFTGRELLLVTSSGTLTFTLESVADGQNRTGDITTYAMTIGEYAAFWFGSKPGWEQSGGKVFLKGSTTGISFAVVRIPG
jgi:hypothetical protein